ncbi:hypothetical protein [Emcibacter sp. SYSU 3D8]|uniref:hypothetical protein n=1 Tax=Emcibacter sp. SYSU 3D8 TaxID=3133969 RepID=UPI0031FEA29B
MAGGIFVFGGQAMAADVAAAPSAAASVAAPRCDQKGGGDCDDTDKACSPGIDNDCDGAADDDAVAKPASTGAGTKNPLHESKGHGGVNPLHQDGE